MDYELINIVYKSGTREKIPATVYGPLAVHRQRGHRDGYTISHVRTGLAIVHVDGRPADAISALSKLDWDFDDPSNIPDATKRAVERHFGSRFMRAEALRTWRTAMKG